MKMSVRHTWMANCAGRLSAAVDSPATFSPWLASPATSLAAVNKGGPTLAGDVDCACCSRMACVNWALFFLCALCASTLHCSKAPACAGKKRKRKKRRERAHSNANQLTHAQKSKFNAHIYTHSLRPLTIQPAATPLPVSSKKAKQSPAARAGSGGCCCCCSSSSIASGNDIASRFYARLLLLRRRRRRMTTSSALLQHGPKANSRIAMCYVCLCVCLLLLQAPAFWPAAEFYGRWPGVEQSGRQGNRLGSTRLDSTRLEFQSRERKLRCGLKTKPNRTK